MRIKFVSSYVNYLKLVIATEYTILQWRTQDFMAA
jgi:hypothetical protein